MKKEELDFILQEGEGYKIEFKENFDVKSFVKEVVAFANSDGGRIFLGVSDLGIVRGVEITNKLKSQIQDIARNCDPKIKIFIEQYRDILIINVLEGKDKPYCCSSGFFLREGPNSQKMQRDEIISFIKSSGKLKFEKIITETKKYDFSLVQKYFEKAGIRQTVCRDSLFNLGVIDENEFLNNAGILFFTLNPKNYFINAYITCARYKGIEKVNVIDRKDFEGDLVSQVEWAVEFVNRNTRLEYEIKELIRKEIPEYPLEAIREAILNAVMHRDYFEEGANVQIDIYDDRLTVTNFGGLISPLTKEKLGTLAVRRNPLIADLFHRIHFVEKMGTGIKRIKEECVKHGKVDFEIETNGYFIAKFKLKNNFLNGKKIDGKILKDEGLSEGLSEGLKLTLKLVIEHPNIKAKEISELSKRPLKTIERHIKNLIFLGKIERKGSRKTGGYILKNEK